MVEWCSRYVYIDVIVVVNTESRLYYDLEVC
jgi:hypothetical protein